MKFEYITQKIIDAATKVHAELGNQFEESIYQKALEKEMINAGLKLKRDYEMSIYYNGAKVGAGMVDFYVENCIMLDVIALVHFDSYYIIQAKSYLEAYNIELGLLINFGTENIQFRKIYNESNNI